MYTLNAIILETYPIHERRHRMIILTREYGKITGWYTGSLHSVDIGDIVSVGISRKEGINHIKWIE